MSAECDLAVAIELDFRYDGDFCWIAKGLSRALGDEPGDTMEHLTRSRIVVTEDGIPLAQPHAPHQQIRSLGAGRFSHWEDWVCFSTSDNSNAFTNGRTYELVSGDRRVLLRLAAAEPQWIRSVDHSLAQRRSRINDVDTWLQQDVQYSWFVGLDELGRRSGQKSIRSNADAIVVYEDGRQLARVADLEGVRERTPGSFLLDGSRLFFSASDGRNPKLNGRRYEVHVGNVRLVIPSSPQALILGSKQPPIAPDIAEIVRVAVTTGLETPFELPYDVDYFHFLAGLVRSRGYTRVLEIGTEHGLSAASLASGMGAAIDTLVTCDIIDEAPILNNRSGVHRVIGDVMSARNIQGILDLFDRKPIDLLFVDSGHDYPTTMAHMGTFASLLRPELILIDDIVLNEEMALCWKDVRAIYGDRAVNACDIDPRVRQGDCGFGLVLQRDAHRAGL